MKPYLTPIASIALLLTTSAAFAGPGHGDGHDDNHAAMMGQPGDAAKADRVINVSMTEMAFEPSSIEVMEGETITFVVSNDGEIVHEFNLGTEKMWQGHLDEMMKMMDTGMMTVDKINHDKMMQAGMMFSGTISQVSLTRCPFDVKLALFTSVFDPIRIHIS